MVCPECSSKFRLRDRVKSMIKKYGEIECSSCRSIFIEKRQNFKVSTSVCIGLIVFLGSIINLAIGKLLKDMFITLSIMIFVVLVLVPIAMFLAQDWVNYEKVN